MDSLAVRKTGGLISAPRMPGVELPPPTHILARLPLTLCSCPAVDGQFGFGQTIGDLLRGHSRARCQDRDLMRRGWHSFQRERGGRRPLLNIGRSHHRNLVLRNRKAHDFIGWKLCGGCTGSVQHEGCGGGDPEQISHDHLPSGLEWPQHGLPDALTPYAPARNVSLFTCCRKIQAGTVNGTPV